MKEKDAATVITKWIWGNQVIKSCSDKRRGKTKKRKLTENE